MRILPLELAAFLIWALYVLFHLSRPGPRRPFVRELGLLCVASWVAEETHLLFYGFYAYSSQWSIFLGHVPLLVVLIWPLVIHSARALASQLLPGRHGSIPFAAAAIVFTDASLMEPVAVRAGLWTWSEPGLFSVPPVVIFGWSYFALMCNISLSRTSSERGLRDQILSLTVLTPLCTHLLILASWWGGLRWLSRPLSPGPAVAAAWVLSILLVVKIVKAGTGKSVGKETLLLRIPGAFFFFTVLGLNLEASGDLVPYALAFVPPYLALMANQYGILPRGPR
jgi:hypothetical protein